ncbi:MAG TPA: hypothetical protein VFA26_17050 [Gemmataceae bacterium]|nr:hypothetical protein [Gemmataceae bacterium]
MNANLRRFLVAGTAALAVVAVLAVTTQAAPPQPAYRVYGAMPYGGFGGFPRTQFIPNSQMFVNPAFRVGPNFTPINQAAYNISTMGRAYYNVPPWLYGYNPYPSPIITTPYYPPYPYYPVYNPYLLYGGGNNFGLSTFSPYASLYP